MIFIEQTTLLLSVLTSLFDEFEQLRPNKQLFKFLFILTLLGSSLYFCTQVSREYLSIPTLYNFYIVFFSFSSLALARCPR